MHVSRPSLFPRFVAFHSAVFMYFMLGHLSLHHLVFRRLHTSVGSALRSALECEIRSVLPTSKRVDENLRHEEPDSHPGSDLDHPETQLKGIRVLLGGGLIIRDQTTAIADSGLERW